MSKGNGEYARPSVSVSDIFDDGTLLETVYRSSAAETAFVIAQEGHDLEIQPVWEVAGNQFVPVAASNNLLKHSAILLPSEPAEFGSAEALVEKIDKYIASYVSLTKEQRLISVAFVLLSWVYDAFNELPYLRFRGDYGTGKSRALLVVGAICYKAFFASGASSIAPIFHTLDLFQGTLVLDEADFRFTDEKAELVKILNNGNARGFPVLRMQVKANREFDPRAFRVFGPKIVGMRACYEDRALESRFLTIDMEPGMVAGAPVNLPERQRDDALTLRNELLMYRLRHRRHTILDASLVDTSLEARTNQILLPLLAVSPTAEMREAILAAARGLHADTLLDLAESIEGRALSVLNSLLRTGGSEPVKLAQITAGLIEEHLGDFAQPVTTRFTGKLLRRLGLALYKRNGVSVLYPGQEERLAKLFGRYGVDNAGASPSAGH
jgi:hypothetical protein